MESKKIAIIESIVILIISFGVLFEGIRLMRVTTRVTQDIMGPGTYIVTLGGLLILGTLIHIALYSVRILRLEEKHTWRKFTRKEPPLSFLRWWA